MPLLKQIISPRHQTIYWPITIYGEKKWHKVFAREVLLGRFKEITLNYFSEAFIVSFWTK